MEMSATVKDPSRNHLYAVCMLKALLLFELCERCIIYLKVPHCFTDRWLYFG